MSPSATVASHIVLRYTWSWPCWRAICRGELPAGLETADEGALGPRSLQITPRVASKTSIERGTVWLFSLLCFWDT